MTKKILEESGRFWRDVRPQTYGNGGGFGKRDYLLVAAAFALCTGAYVLHDVYHVLPLPSEETMGFFGVVTGLFLGRKLRR